MASFLVRVLCRQGSLVLRPGRLLPSVANPTLEPPVKDFLRSDRRGYRHRGALKLLCRECRYVIRRWHVPILAVDCNANPRHKQAMTNLPPRSRMATEYPDYLAPWVEGKQYPRKPQYRQAYTFACYSKRRHQKLR